eukprot:TRINITY_DN1650_c1_g1_i4.p1 TRINITY_DN1650_c1_g1~~TRINITY_DN1650_c1_g1_i4.p1  ORF type:complete len:475 (+),score=61.10 TRINITY_DN1650_c1_g1_i4:145-1425(+)
MAASGAGSFHSDGSDAEQSSSAFEAEAGDVQGASLHGDVALGTSAPGRSVYVESGSELYDLPDPDELAASGMRTGLSSESDSSSSSYSSSSAALSASSRSSSSSRRHGQPRVTPPTVADDGGSEAYDLPPPPSAVANPSSVYVESGSELYDLPDPDELAASGMRTGNTTESESSSSSSSSSSDGGAVASRSRVGMPPRQTQGRGARRPAACTMTGLSCQILTRWRLRGCVAAPRRTDRPVTRRRAATVAGGLAGVVAPPLAAVMGAVRPRRGRLCTRRVAGGDVSTRAAPRTAALAVAAAVAAGAAVTRTRWTGRVPLRAGRRCPLAARLWLTPRHPSAPGVTAWQRRPSPSTPKRLLRLRRRRRRGASLMLRPTTTRLSRRRRPPPPRCRRRRLSAAAPLACFLPSGSLTARRALAACTRAVRGQ